MTWVKKVAGWLVDHGITNPREALAIWLITIGGLAVLFVVMLYLPFMGWLCVPMFIPGLAILVLIVVILAIVQRKKRARGPVVMSHREGLNLEPSVDMRSAEMLLEISDMASHQLTITTSGSIAPPSSSLATSRGICLFWNMRLSG